jgi:hypothetical protein
MWVGVNKSVMMFYFQAEEVPDAVQEDSNYQAEVVSTDTL